MAYEITETDVGAAGVAYIPFVNQADTCLTNNGVAEDIGKQLKILGVKHLTAMARDGGQVTEERAVSGAYRSYAEGKSGTGYLETLRAMDATGCVLRLLVNNSNIRLMSAGRSAL